MNLDQQKPGEKSGKRKAKQSKKKEKKSPKSGQTLATEELIDATVASPDAVEAEAVAAVAAEATVAAETEAAVAASEIEQTAAAVAPVEDVAPVDTAPADPAPAEPVARVASFKERMASVVPLADTAPSKLPAPADIAPAVPAPVEAPVRTAPVEPAAPPVAAQSVPAPAAVPVTGIQAIARVYRDYTRKSLEDAQSFAEKLSAARSLDKAVEAQAEYAQKACENFAADSRKIRELHRELFWQTFRLPYWPTGRSR
jgi:phasin protein